MTQVLVRGSYPESGSVSITSDIATPSCRVCGASVEVFLDQGQQPIANGFHLAGPDEPKYRIQYAFCPACYLVQIVEQPPASVMFNESYAFLTGSSQGMVDYYAELADTLRERHDPQTVLEIGCNDGTFLENLADLDHLGIDPSANVAEIAAGKGLAVHIAPWGIETARNVARAWKYGKSIDLICAFHCITHIADLAGFLAGVKLVLAPDGVLVLEDPSLAAIVKAGELDQGYDEHAVILSLPAIAKALARHGMEIINAEPVPTHGGSMRVTAARVGAHPVVFPAVLLLVDAEDHLTISPTFHQFGDQAKEKIRELRDLLLNIKSQGGRIAAYGASSKLTLILNRLNLPAGTLEYVSDVTATKIGRKMPGTHEPIISREDAQDRLPSYFLLGAWVHAAEVLKKEREFLEGGGHFIVWNPHVKTIGLESL